MDPYVLDLDEANIEMVIRDLDPGDVQSLAKLRVGRIFGSLRTAKQDAFIPNFDY